MPSSKRRKKGTNRDPQPPNASDPSKLPKRRNLSSLRMSSSSTSRSSSSRRRMKKMEIITRHPRVQPPGIKSCDKPGNKLTPSSGSSSTGASNSSGSEASPSCSPVGSSPHTRLPSKAGPKMPAISAFPGTETGKGKPEEPNDMTPTVFEVVAPKQPAATAVRTNKGATTTAPNGGKQEAGEVLVEFDPKKPQPEIPRQGSGPPMVCVDETPTAFIAPQAVKKDDFNPPPNFISKYLTVHPQHQPK
ncbi:hypothetical protein QR680_009972 [Steinernema hermaphroditum]|uniref:Uncharacterized protein n=1 Tax=Steinernema hermaphroditum TaxID=289476 RepID=A0AA39IP70_9BILA|nr:hypothetical protein QR680_009972 [Steinernema hermaphroditum]